MHSLPFEFAGKNNGTPLDHVAPAMWKSIGLNRMGAFMRKPFRAFQAMLPTVFFLTLIGLPAYGQRHNEPDTLHNGLIQDWSRRQVVFPRIGSVHSLVAAGRDPRAILSWQAAARADWHRGNDFRDRHHTKSSLHRDWSISLGAGGTSAAMYPAKFSFDLNATPDCTTDFIVYPVNAVGSGTQPNLVAFNNLYSGTGRQHGNLQSRDSADRRRRCIGYDALVL